MCDICRKTPCDSRCPNAPEPPIVFECYNCGKPIRVGDDYLKIGAERYCIKCCFCGTAEFDDIETEEYP